MRIAAVHSAPEPLEARIAPATIYAVSNTSLIAFDSATPTSFSNMPLTGLAGAAGEDVVGMDFRPATGQLYLLTVDSLNAGRLYQVDHFSGAARLVGSPLSGVASAASYGFDFNPAVDRIRVVNSAGDNFRVNPDTAAVVNGVFDTALSYTGPATGPVLAAAYTENFSGTFSTTLYAIDTGADHLVLIGGVNSSPHPNLGAVTSVGALGVNATDAHFDIANGTGTAFAAMTVGGVTSLYTLDLATGAPTSVGTIGAGNLNLKGMAVQVGDLKFPTAATATYTDEDGDLVTVKLSKGSLSPLDFQLSVGANGGGLLRSLLLNDDGAEFDGANLAITSKAANGGDGLVRVGHINSAGSDLGTVLVDGDLGRISAGDIAVDPAVKSLTVQSMGRSGTTTQASLPSTKSNLAGPVGSITVKSDVVGSFINISAGTLSKLTIGGSLIGDSTPNSGRISVIGDIGSVSIGQDIRGSGAFSGSVEATGKMGTVTIGGSILGGPGSDSGRVASVGDMGAVKIGRNLEAGIGAGSAVVTSTTGKIKSLTIGGSIFGNEDNSGRVFAFGDMGAVLVKGDIQGGAGDDSGQIEAQKIAAVTITGSIIGGGGEASGAIWANTSLTTVKVGRELAGGTGSLSGYIWGTSAGAISIGLSMIGGAGPQSGSIEVDGPIASVKVGGDVRGGDGASSAYIHGKGTLGPVAIKGSLVGGVGDFSASIYSGNAFVVGNVMKGVTIAGNVLGGSGQGSAAIGTASGALGSSSGLEIGPVAIKGSVIGSGDFSATITAGKIAGITIGGDLRGGGTASAVINASVELKTLSIAGSVIGAADSSSYIIAAKLGTAKIGRDLRGGGVDSGAIFVNLGGAKSITVGGNVTTGTGDRSGSISVNSVLGSLTIGGDVVGNAAKPLILSARGTDGTMALAIGKLAIKGSVTFTQILAGQLAGSVNNADANLGPITIGGDFIASSISAGVGPGADNEYGTLDDAIGTFNHTAGSVSRITSVIIKGQALGTVSTFNPNDDFGIVAQEIKVLKIGGATYAPLNATTQGPINLAVTNDLRARTDV